MALDNLSANGWKLTRHINSLIRTYILIRLIGGPLLRNELWEKDIGYYYCCTGYECGCRGISIEDMHLEMMVYDN